jgi:hypothetical protein
MTGRIDGAVPVSTCDAGTDGSNGTVDTVRVGENTLSDFARNRGVDPQSVLQANPQFANVNARVQIGQELNLPTCDSPSMAGNLPDLTPDKTRVTGLPSAPVEDPLSNSAMKARLGDTPSMNRAGPMGTGNASMFASLPGVIADLFTRGAKHPETKKEFTEAQNAIAAGDYGKAHDILDRMLSRQAEDVLPEEDVKSTQTVRDQLEFLSKVQKAGVKADYPPTEAQLTDYFKTLKDKPDAARQAFQDYASAFQVHPANLKNGDVEVKYSQQKVQGHDVNAPKDWSDVSKHPVSSPPEFVGKQENDCKGYAYMATKLLGAAGFKVAHNIAVYPGPNNLGHAMVMFTHPPEKGVTVTSNDKVFHGDNPKEVAKDGFTYAAGKATGQEHYYTGNTLTGAMVEQVLKNHEL